MRCGHSSGPTAPAPRRPGAAPSRSRLQPSCGPQPRTPGAVSTDSSPLNGNFAVAEAGLLVHYNPFAVAGAAGTEPTQILLTRNELRPLLADGSLLAATPHQRMAFPSPEQAPIEAVDPQGGWDTTDVPR